jgi:4'-phosphopantetheinyl transferase
MSLASKIPLAPGEIHLWLTPYEEVPDDGLRSQYRLLLSPEEKAQELRFYSAKDRLRYMVTRALVRIVLSRYAALASSDWIFSANGYGRPEISNSFSPDLDLCFNVSHTPSLIVLAVTNGCSIGVDVENVLVRGSSIDVAERFFAPAEVTALVGLPLDQQHYRFFEYWTFKESYIKARGLGLSLPLDSFSFCFPNDDSVQIEIGADLKDDPTRWQFWQFRPKPEYLVALCAEKVGPGRLSPRVREIVPLVSERPLSLRYLRTSEPSIAR